MRPLYLSRACSCSSWPGVPTPADPLEGCPTPPWLVLSLWGAASLSRAAPTAAAPRFPPRYADHSQLERYCVFLATLSPASLPAPRGTTPRAPCSLHAARANLPSARGGCPALGGPRSSAVRVGLLLMRPTLAIWGVPSAASSLWYLGVSCMSSTVGSPGLAAEALTPLPQNVALFGNKVIADITS